MKLSRIPGTETTIKTSFAFKTSTMHLLKKYHALYMVAINGEVAMKDLVEQMLLDFMAEDKVFQRELRKENDRSTGKAEQPTVRDTTEVATISSTAPNSDGQLSLDASDI